MDIFFGILGTIILYAVFIGLWRDARLAREAEQFVDDDPDDEIEESETPDYGLNYLGDIIGTVNRANGWRTFSNAEDAWTHNPYYIPAVLALVTSEVSEALEAFRKHDRTNFDEEVADIVIRALDLANLLDIDIDSAVHAKLAKNRTRGYRHGGKRV